MIEIHTNLHIGNQDDYEFNVRTQEGWYVVHACKDPYHRRLLGYTGRGAPRNHPEYLFARREKRLILNLIDADDPRYIPKEIIDYSLDFIHEGLSLGSRVLVHCNQGLSRAPVIGFLYLIRYTDLIKSDEFITAETQFREWYPNYFPKWGMRGFAQLNFDYYRMQNHHKE